MVEIKKLKIKWSFFILFAIVLSACAHHEDPTITVEAKVTQLTQKEFSSVGTKGLDNPTREDFRKFIVNFKMEDVDSLQYQIDAPQDWKKYINKDRKRYWYGNGTEKDNMYSNEFIFYAKGLSEDEIIEAFSSAVITAAWVTEKGKEKTQDYVIGDFIEIH